MGHASFELEVDRATSSENPLASAPYEPIALPIQQYKAVRSCPKHYGLARKLSNPHSNVAHELRKPGLCNSFELFHPFLVQIEIQHLVSDDAW
jgi:hypothetical protein